LDRHQRFLYIPIFTAGMTTLALELSASRLLGSVFGTSNLVWANIIGLILLYLTAGYFLGGRWADRSPHYTTFYRLLCWAAFTAGLVPLIARPVLRAAANAVLNVNAPVLVGSFGVVLILFSVPITLLGTISPFAIRLALRDVEASGSVAGRIYAISTLGSILGTFTPVLLLIPAVGTARTFLIFAGLLLVIALWGLAQHDRRKALTFLWMPLALAILASLVLRGTLKPPPPGGTLLYETESAYNYIQ
jgi:predicted membrane-bound spermidine synthase